MTIIIITYIINLIIIYVDHDLLPPPDVVRLYDPPVVLVAIRVAAAVLLPREAAPGQEVKEHVSEGLRIKGHS